MFRHRKLSKRERLILALRAAAVRATAWYSLICPGCGSSRVTGSARSWICHNCGSMGQS